jgi:hypothetical protein
MERIDEPCQDDYGVDFTVPYPGAQVSLRRLYDVRRTLETRYPALFPRVGWCTASEDGFEVLRTNVAPGCGIFQWRHRFGDDEKRGDYVFQIRLLDCPVRTPKVTTASDGDPAAASNPAGLITHTDRGKRRYKDVPHMHARFKYGATARHVAAFVHALLANGFVILSTRGVDLHVDAETVRVAEIRRDKLYYYVLPGEAAMLHRAYKAYDAIDSHPSTYMAAKKFRDHPY